MSLQCDHPQTIMWAERGRGVMHVECTRCGTARDVPEAGFEHRRSQGADLKSELLRPSEMH